MFFVVFQGQWQGLHPCGALGLTGHSLFLCSHHSLDGGSSFSQRNPSHLTHTHLPPHTNRLHTNRFHINRLHSNRLFTSTYFTPTAFTPTDFTRTAFTVNTFTPTVFTAIDFSHQRTSQQPLSNQLTSQQSTFLINGLHTSSKYGHLGANKFGFTIYAI